jgi:hypothetical protein
VRDIKVGARGSASFPASLFASHVRHRSGYSSSPAKREAIASLGATCGRGRPTNLPAYQAAKKADSGLGRASQQFFRSLLTLMSSSRTTPS